jgi:3-methyladenine DNA glycosylase AlkD
MSDVIQQRAAAIEKALSGRGNAARAEFFSSGYSPSSLRCLGVAVPDMRDVIRAEARALAAAGPREIVDLARVLVERGTVEGRQVGYELIARRRDAMALLDTRTVQQLGAGNDNWASVDGFAAYLAGPAWRTGLVNDADVLRWSRSRDKWWRRTALAASVALNTKAHGGTGDTRRTLLVCESNAAETDPMIAKALSWALRSLVPHDPAAVRAFLDRHGEGVPALVRREVSTKIRTGKRTVKSTGGGGVKGARGRGVKSARGHGVKGARGRGVKSTGGHGVKGARGRGVTSAGGQGVEGA